MSGKRITELQQSTTLKNDSLLLVTTGSENGNLTRAITLEQFKNSICADYNTDGDVSDLFYSAAKIDEILSENEENYQNWHNEHVSISEEVATNKANINANLSKIKVNTNLINMVYNEQEQEFIKDSGKTLYTYFDDKTKSLNDNVDEIWTLMVGSSVKNSLKNNGISVCDPRGKDIGTFDTAYGALNNRITALENSIASSKSWESLKRTEYDTAEGDPYTTYITLRDDIGENITKVRDRIKIAVGLDEDIREKYNTNKISIKYGGDLKNIGSDSFHNQGQCNYHPNDKYTLDGKLYPIVIDYMNSHELDSDVEHNWVVKNTNVTGMGDGIYGLTDIAVLELKVGAQVEDLRQHGLGHYHFNTESSFTAHDYNDEDEGEYCLVDKNSDYHLSNGKYIPLVPYINPIRTGSEKYTTTGSDVDRDILDFSYIDRINLTAGKRFNELEEKIDKNDDINQKMDLLVTNSSYYSSGTDQYEPANPDLIYKTYRALETTDKDIDELFGSNDGSNNKRWYTTGGLYTSIDPSNIERDIRDISIRKDLYPSIAKSGLSSISGSYFNISATRKGCQYYLSKLIDDYERPSGYTDPQDNDEWYALTQESVIDAAVGALRKDVDYLYKIISGEVGDYCSFYGIGFDPESSDPYITHNDSKNPLHKPYIELTENNSYASFEYMYAPDYEAGNYRYGAQGLAIRKDKVNENYKFISFRLEPSTGSFNTQFPDTIFKYSISDLYEAGKQCYANGKNDAYVYLTKTIPGDILNIRTGENSMLMITLGARLANMTDKNTVNTKTFKLTDNYNNIVTSLYNDKSDYYCFKLDLKLYIYCITESEGNYNCYTSKKLKTLRQKYWLVDSKIMC